MPAKAEIKYGFFVGLGLALAILVLTMLQVFTLRAVKRGG
jgi:heme exporter protein D